MNGVDKPVLRLVLIVLLGMLTLTVSSHCSADNFQQVQDYQIPSQFSDSFLEELRQKAEAITVKIVSEDVAGSGVLIHRHQDEYLVVTNHHVIAFSAHRDYQVETPDAQLHPAELLTTVKVETEDLGLLVFRSQTDYQTIPLEPSPQIRKDEAVFVAGFPLEADVHQSRGFVFTQGQVVMITSQPIEGGYQIGYTNDVQKGMSGGPVLNRQGKLIGINGLHKYPVWDNPYVFDDGTIVSDTEQEKMRQFSWAIPLQTLLDLLPELISSPEK